MFKNMRPSASNMYANGVVIIRFILVTPNFPIQ
jgi:hypothetical protein